MLFFSLQLLQLCPESLFEPLFIDFYNLIMFHHIKREICLWMLSCDLASSHPPLLQDPLCGLPRSLVFFFRSVFIHLIWRKIKEYTWQGWKQGSSLSKNFLKSPFLTYFYSNNWGWKGEFKWGRTGLADYMTWQSSPHSLREYYEWLVRDNDAFLQINTGFKHW